MKQSEVPALREQIAELEKKINNRLVPWNLFFERWDELSLEGLMTDPTMEELKKLKEPQ